MHDRAQRRFAPGSFGNTGLKELTTGETIDGENNQKKSKLSR